jgi:hypothetical protein
MEAYNRPWGDLAYEENLKKTSSQKRAEKEEFEAKIAFMEAMREKQDALEADLHKATQFAQAQLREAQDKLRKAAQAARKVEDRVVVTMDKAKRSYIEKMRKRYTKNGKLERLPIMCKNHCLGSTEDCWAHDFVEEKDKVCPFIHRSETGWDSTKCKGQTQKAGHWTRKVRTRN